MRGRRRYVQKELIDSWPGISIHYTGMKLDQPDLRERGRTCNHLNMHINAKLLTYRNRDVLKGAAME